MGRGRGQQLSNFQSATVSCMAQTSTMNCLSPLSLNASKTLFALKSASSHPLPKRAVPISIGVVQFAAYGFGCLIRQTTHCALFLAGTNEDSRKTYY